jgi:hypothetical protein
VLVVKDLAAAAQSVATAVALAVGGIWAYYKFFRSRTFRPRLEGAVQARLVRSGGRRLIDVTVTIKNAGLTRLDLTQEGSGLRFFCNTGEESDYLYDQLPWRHLITHPVFTAHAWVEPSESISDRLLVQLEDDAALAYRLELRLVAGTSRNAPAHTFVQIVLPEQPGGGPAAQRADALPRELTPPDDHQARRTTMQGA